MKTTADILAEGTFVGSMEGTEWVDFSTRVFIPALAKTAQVYLTLPSPLLRGSYPPLEHWMHRLASLDETVGHAARATLWAHYCAAHNLDAPYDATAPETQELWKNGSLSVTAEAEDLENEVIRLVMEGDWWDLGVEVWEG